MRNPLRVAVQRIGEEEPLLLAHHPTCRYYSHHTFELYGQQLCMGCFVVYPVGLLALSSLIVVRLAVPDAALFGLSTPAFYGLAMALIGPKVVESLSPGRWRTRSRIAVKALLAVGLALLAFPFVFRPADRLVTVALFVGFLIPYVAYKGLTALDDCQGCPQRDDFPDCTGMTVDGTYEYADETTTVTPATGTDAADDTTGAPPAQETGE
jgi:hypothetical protein